MSMQLAAEKRRSRNYAEELRLLKVRNLAVQKQVSLVTLSTTTPGSTLSRH